MKEFWLDHREYAKIVSEINTNYRKYSGKRKAIHFSYGIDNRSYAYYFENYDFDAYRIYARIEIE